MEIIIVTKTAREKILVELEAFLANVECSQLNAVEVFGQVNFRFVTLKLFFIIFMSKIIHLASTDASVQSETIQESRPKLVWHALGEEGDVEFFFKVQKIITRWYQT